MRRIKITKLNNHGWGLGTMILFMCILLIFIIIVAVEAKRMDITQGNNGGINLVPIVSATPTSTPTGTPTPITTTVPKPTNTQSADNNNNDELAVLDNKIKESAKQYYIKNYGTLVAGDSIYISIQRLISSEELEQPVYQNEKCSGYVLVSVAPNNDTEYNTYLKCGSYESKGYSAAIDLK